jgi:hypothetical protein
VGRRAPAWPNCKPSGSMPSAISTKCWLLPHSWQCWIRMSSTSASMPKIVSPESSRTVAGPARRPPGCACARAGRRGCRPAGRAGGWRGGCGRVAACGGRGVAWYTLRPRGPLAQWSELAAHTRLVAGSSPAGPIFPRVCSGSGPERPASAKAGQEPRVWPTFADSPLCVAGGRERPSEAPIGPGRPRCTGTGTDTHSAPAAMRSAFATGKRSSSRRNSSSRPCRRCPSSGRRSCAASAHAQGRVRGVAPQGSREAGPDAVDRRRPAARVEQPMPAHSASSFNQRSSEDWRRGTPGRCCGPGPCRARALAALHSLRWRRSISASIGCSTTTSSSRPFCLRALDLGDFLALGEGQFAPRQLGQFADAQAGVGERQVDAAPGTPPSAGLPDVLRSRSGASPATAAPAEPPPPAPAGRSVRVVSARFCGCGRPSVIFFGRSSLERVARPSPALDCR